MSQEFTNIALVVAFIEAKTIILANKALFSAETKLLNYRKIKLKLIIITMLMDKIVYFDSLFTSL
jgi:hypothetical protein